MATEANLGYEKFQSISLSSLKSCQVAGASSRTCSNSGSSLAIKFAGVTVAAESETTAIAVIIAVAEV